MSIFFYDKIINVITVTKSLRFIDSLKREAFLYVALPKNYHLNTLKRYPVLYCHDGHNLFYEADSYGGVTWGMQEAMALTSIPEFIVVALSCASKGNHRLEEYNVFQGRFPSHPTWKIQGRGRDYLDYLLGPLKQEIDQTYRTLPQPEHTFMMGSSMGGVISLEAAYLYTHRVQHIAGLSNAFYVSTPEIRSMIQQFTGSIQTVYLDTGDQEEGLEIASSYLESNRLVQQAIQRQGHVQRFLYQEIQGGIHHESHWKVRLPSILQFLFHHYQ